MLSNLDNCIRDIRTWLTINKLMLNESRYAKSVPKDISLTIGNATITSSPKVRDLGVLFDENLNMVSHVNDICRRASYAIHRIGKLRRYLDKQNTEKLVHAFVSSRLDNCNSILAGLPEKDLSKLQRVQNMAARVVTLTRKSEHITPVLFRLHWLQIRERIVYKILLMTFKILNGDAPAYMSDMISRYEPSRTLRSASQHLLCEISCQTVTYGRSFGVISPKLWNSLPVFVRNSSTIGQFKSRLKSHLFKLSLCNPFLPSTFMLFFTDFDLFHVYAS